MNIAIFIYFLIFVIGVLAGRLSMAMQYAFMRKRVKKADKIGYTNK